MAIIFLILGTILGFSIGHSMLDGAFGGLIGFLLAKVYELRAQVQLLSNKSKMSEDVYNNSNRIDTLSKKVEQISNAVFGRQQQDQVDVASINTEKEPATSDNVSLFEQRLQSISKEIPDQQDESSTSTHENYEIKQKPKPAKKPDNSSSLSLENIFTKYVIGFLTGGNALVRVGIVVLFFGIAFLVKYASAQLEFPIQYRLISIAVGALALLVVGWKTRIKKPGFGLALIGGGVGTLYLTVYAAFRLYDLIPPSFAFSLLVFIAISSAVIAVRLDAYILAAFSVIGGFVAPILASTGAGSHVQLFSYYVILNITILIIAKFKSWRSLNIIGAVSTFFIGTLWGYKYYDPQYFATTEPFLIVYFIMYTLIAMLFATRKFHNNEGILDGVIVFGVPTIVFALQAQLVEGMEYGLTYSAVGFGMYYLLCAFATSRINSSATLIVNAFYGIAIVFLTLAIPLAFQEQVTSAVWALEGAALIWLGIQQKQWYMRIFGVALQAFSSVLLLTQYSDYVNLDLLIHQNYFGSLLIVASALFSALLIRSNQSITSDYEYSIFVNAFCGVGLFWWLYGGLSEVTYLVPNEIEKGAILAFFALSAFICTSICDRLNWKIWRYPLYGYLVLLLLVLGMTDDHPFEQGGIIGWPVAIGAWYWALYKQHRYDKKVSLYLHLVSFWLVSGLVVWESYWLINQFSEIMVSWKQFMYAWSPLLVAGVLIKFREKWPWPISEFRKEYVEIGLLPIAAVLVLWTIRMNIAAPGSFAPLAYLPLINPIDLLTMATIFVGVLYTRQIKPTLLDLNIYRQYFFIAGIALFGWVNAITLRTLHFLKDIPFDMHIMMSSQYVQTTFSILWSVLAVALMVVGSRKALRYLWLVGAALIAAVVIKLFIIDLSNTATIERIVAFIVVGLLLLLVGYFSPVPPKQETAKNIREAT